MASPKLRAVQPGDVPVKPRILTVLEAAESGSRRDELVAMRRRIAQALDDPNTSARDLAALSRRQIEISKEITVIDTQADRDAESVEVGDAEFDAKAI